MPPNSQYIKVDSEVINLSSTANKIISMDRGESLVSATTDVAATQKSPGSDRQLTSEENPVDDDAGFDDFLKVINKADETENKPRNPTEETLATVESEGLVSEAGGDKSKKQLSNDPPKERRKSSELKSELAKNSLMDSVMTAVSFL